MTRKISRERERQIEDAKRYQEKQAKKQNGGHNHHEVVGVRVRRVEEGGYCKFITVRQVGYRSWRDGFSEPIRSEVKCSEFNGHCALMEFREDGTVNGLPVERGTSSVRACPAVLRMLESRKSVGNRRL